MKCHSELVNIFFLGCMGYKTSYLWTMKVENQTCVNYCMNMYAYLKWL